jgi:putative transposase
MRKTYTAAFKAKIITEILREQKSLSQIAAENGIHPNLLTKWKQTALEGLPTLFERDSQSHGNEAAQEKKTAELYEQIGRLTTQVNWLKKKSGLDPDT